MALPFPNPQPDRDRPGFVSRRRRSAENLRRFSAGSSRFSTRAAKGAAPGFQPESTPSPQRNLARTSWVRLAVVWSVLLLAMLLLSLNLLRIQVFQSPMLRERAKEQQMIDINSTVPRRPIIDRTGNVLAIDKPVYTLYAHPILFQEPKETIIMAIAPLVKKTPEELLKRFSQGSSGLRIANGLSEEVSKQINALLYDGLELVQEQQRLYPQQDLFANVVGYVNVDRKGQAGVELSQSGQLEQHIKEMQVSRSGDGSIIPINLPSDFLKLQKDDLRLQLTLDSRLQRAARFALKQQLRKYSAKRGTVMVMDVRDGEILSLVSEPSYDPNKYYQADMEHLRDWVLTDLYEPGSTFKPINLSIALESGAIQPDDTFIDEGRIQIGEWPIQDSDYESMGGRGRITVTQILEYSSNVGMVHVMQLLQPGVYYGWLERVGLGKPTGIDLPAEVTPQLKDYGQFTRALIEPATTAFGQGFSLTPIKLLQLQGIIANGGKMVTPHVVRGLVDPDGKLTWQPDLPSPRKIFSPQTTQTVLGMMEKVVQRGTGRGAQISGYRIAGKTGTAQKASPNGGYTDARITSFVGILPVEAPRYVVISVMDEPQGEDAYGSTVNAPVVKSVMESLITLEQISPSQVQERDLLSQNNTESSGNDDGQQTDDTPDDASGDNATQDQPQEVIEDW